MNTAVSHGLTTQRSTLQLDCKKQSVATTTIAFCVYKPNQYCCITHFTWQSLVIGGLQLRGWFWDEGARDTPRPRPSAGRGSDSSPTHLSNLLQRYTICSKMCNCACMYTKLPSNKVKHSRNHTPVLSSGIYSCVVPFYTKCTCIYQQACACVTLYAYALCMSHWGKNWLAEVVFLCSTVHSTFRLPCTLEHSCNIFVQRLQLGTGREAGVAGEHTTLEVLYTHKQPLCTQNHAPCQ